MPEAPLQTPEALLQRVATGDAAAFAALYALWGGMVHQLALRYLNDAEEAEEATQDVFLAIYAGAGAFGHRSEARTWAYRITITTCLDRLRHRHRKKRFAVLQSLFGGDGALLHDAPDPTPNPHLLTDSPEQARLHAALATLPERQRTAMLLTYVEDLPGKDVAAIMQLTEKAVESLRQRAKASLRKTLGKP